jgi:hypothetical protein
MYSNDRDFVVRINQLRPFSSHQHEHTGFLVKKANSLYPFLNSLLSRRQTLCPNPVTLVLVDVTPDYISTSTGYL